MDPDATANGAGPAGAPPRETADIETSSADYAARFAGPAGEWMLSVQSRIVTGWMAATPGASVLDVGGGHGQLATPLADAGHSVTVLGSDEACADGIAAEIGAGRIRFAAGDLLALPFPDRSFDTVVSIRLLPHCARWPALVAELCRVARRSAIVDYPALYSVNLLSGALFGAKKRIEKNTRPFTLFRHAGVAAEFVRHGFRIHRRRAEFFLPMVLHRVLRRPGLSAALEGLCRGLGLTALAGSPVLVEARREGQA